MKPESLECEVLRKPFCTTNRRRNQGIEKVIARPLGFTEQGDDADSRNAVHGVTCWACSVRVVAYRCQTLAQWGMCSHIPSTAKDDLDTAMPSNVFKSIEVRLPLL
jgi:hypothetical protein